MPDHYFAEFYCKRFGNYQYVKIYDSFYKECSMDQLQDKRRSNCTVHQKEWLVGKHGRKSANECVKCGKCEEVCSQHIKIRDELEKVAAELLG